MRKLYQFTLNKLSLLIKYTTYSTINSVCKGSAHQDIEPYSLMRLKKIKD